jgi:hypothetical protein
MSVQVRRRRETASFLATFVGAQGELLVDTTNNRVQVHDGATAGGFSAAKLSEVVTNTRIAVADATYNAVSTDRTIAYTALTVSRIVNLPAASTYPTGTQLLVVDEAGLCTAARTITIDAAGADLINGASVAVIALPYGFLAIESNGISKWTIIDQSTTSLAQQAVSAVAVTGGSIDATTIGGTTPAAGSFTTVSTTGIVASTRELRGPGGSALRAVGTTYGVILRNDDTNFYLLATAPGSPLGTFGSIRPFAFSLSTGLVSMTNGATVGGTLTASAVAISGGAINGVTLGATTASAVRGTTVAATTSVNLPSYSVTALPTPGTAGRVVYCSNARMQTSTAGTLEASGAGTGGIVSDNGTAWKISGTNISRFRLRNRRFIDTVPSGRASDCTNGRERNHPTPPSFH